MDAVVVNHGKGFDVHPLQIHGIGALGDILNGGAVVILGRTNAKGVRYKGLIIFSGHVNAPLCASREKSAFFS